jgi:glycosyltransferase involved in cell wall biosynthesis
MKPDSAILTIAIPTYNRAARLQAQLERLLPQLGPEVRLCVYDNASPDHTREVVAKFPGVSYFRAVTNCGAGRNIFRCFEECRTEWLWVLSDDDLAKPTAVADLLNLLRSETADFIHANSWLSQYKQDILVTNLSDLFQHSNFSSLMWLTAGVYRVPAFHPWFQVYNEGLSTWAPHTLMVLSLLATGKSQAHLSPLELTVPTTTPISWSTLGCLSRLSLLPELLIGTENQQLVAGRIYFEYFNNFMLTGLRETNSIPGTRRWQRVCRQTRRNFKAYGINGIFRFVMGHWFRYGHRHQSWRLATQAVCIQLLNWCPVPLFHFLAGCLPLQPDIRVNYYGQRHACKPNA